MVISISLQETLGFDPATHSLGQLLTGSTVPCVKWSSISICIMATPHPCRIRFPGLRVHGTLAAAELQTRPCRWGALVQP